jgi:hypothetical protein
MRRLLVLVLAFINIYAMYGQPHFPLKISENLRYFVDQDGKPFLYHADTGWQIFCQLTTAEAVEYLSFRKSQGFNTIQVQLVMYPEQANRYGQKPFQKNGPEKNRQYGRYLGKKFASFNNLFWIMGGDNDPKGDRESLFAFFDGLYSAAPKHQLMTYHASPPHSSTDMFQYAGWLGFSFIYTYWREKPGITPELMPHVYEAAISEWSKSDIMPFVLGESQYEGSGRVASDIGEPQVIRRQAYWTMLCGGAGEAYGSDLWNFPADWRDVMRYPGAFQLGHFIKFFESIPWWTLVPDINHQAVVNGFGEWSKPDWVSTAVSEDKKLMVSYIPQLRSVTVDFGYLSGSSFIGRFYDPRSGKLVREFSNDTKTVQRIFSPRGEDLLLLIRSSDNQ